MPRPIPPAGRAEVGSSRSLTLLVVGLTGAGWPDRPEILLEGLELDALQGLLARGDRIASGVDGREAELRRLFDGVSGSRADPDIEFPVAALTLYSDSGRRPEGYWLRADPVHIEAGRDRLIMTGGEGLELGADEARALCDEINTHLAGEGMYLIAPTPARWYFRWPQAPELCFEPLTDVIGDDLFHHMPGGEAGRDWRRRLNEIQMLMHASPVNHARREQGRVEVSGVWIWGGGVLPDARGCAFSAVWSDDPLTRGIALNAGLTPAATPALATAWLSAAGPGAHLLTIDTLQAPLQLGDLETWRARLASLQRDWIAPLADALRDRGIDRLIISAAAGAEYHVTRRALRRWWRRTRPLTGYH